VQDADDYAFTAHYDATRLAKSIVELRSVVRSQVIGLVISVAFAVFIWYSNREDHSIFRVFTLIIVGAIAVAIVLQLVALVLARMAEPGSTKPGVAVGLTLGAAVVLLLPATFMAISSGSMSATLFAFDLGAAITGLFAVLITLHVGAAVTLGLLITGAVLLAVWKKDEAHKHWFLARNLMAAGILAPSVLCLLNGILAAVLGQVLSSKIESLNDVYLDRFQEALAADWSTWLIASMLGLVIARMGLTTANLACLVMLLDEMPIGPALRIDAAGMALADPKTLGPDRANWNEISISVRPHERAPGAELVIKRWGHKPWSVPLMYLDVLPGTLDSAIRSATLGAKVLNLESLNRIF
jgi:hypothetical protein